MRKLFLFWFLQDNPENFRLRWKFFCEGEKCKMRRWDCLVLGKNYHVLVSYEEWDICILDYWPLGSNWRDELLSIANSEEIVVDFWTNCISQKQYKNLKEVRLPESIAGSQSPSGPIRDFVNKKIYIRLIYSHWVRR